MVSSLDRLQEELLGVVHDRKELILAIESYQRARRNAKTIVITEHFGVVLQLDLASDYEDINKALERMLDGAMLWDGTGPKAISRKPQSGGLAHD